MVKENILNLLEEYKEYLQTCKDSKKELKKKVNELKRLETLNKQHNIDVSTIEKSISKVTKDIEYINAEISKGKKVIYRLNVCLNIINDEETTEE